MGQTVEIAPSVGHNVLCTEGGVGAAPGYDAIDLRRMVKAAGCPQQGVMAESHWKVSENSAGQNMQVEIAANRGVGAIEGDSVLEQGRYGVAPHATTILLDVPPADVTNPRIDLVILRVYDDARDGLGLNTAQAELLEGAPTAGATKDNLLGADVVPDNAILLAAVQVDHSVTKITNASIRDRRPRALGAKSSRLDPDSTIHALFSNAGYKPATAQRIECSGAPLLIIARYGGISNNAAGAPTYNEYLRLLMDGAAVAVGKQPTAGGALADAFAATQYAATDEDPRLLTGLGSFHTVIAAPVPGSHLFEQEAHQNNLAGGGASCWGPWELTIIELPGELGNAGTS